MSFGTQKRFSPKKKDLELLKEHQEQQHLQSRRLMTRGQHHAQNVTNPPSARDTDFRIKPVTPPMILEKKSVGKIDLDLKKVNEAAKLLSEPPDDHRTDNFIMRSRSNKFLSGATGSPSYLAFEMQRHNTFPEDSHKRLEREERQYRRRLELLQSQSMEKASEVSRLQTTIKELQTEVETTNQESIRHEKDSDNLSTSVDEVTREVESSETAIAESNERVASLHEIFEGILERVNTTEQTYTRAKSQQEDLGTAKEKMLSKQEIGTREVNSTRHAKATRSYLPDTKL